MDPVCHSGWEGTGAYIGNVLKKVHDGSTIAGNDRIAIIGSNATTTSCGANWATQLSTQFLAGFTTAPAVDFYVTDAQITAFFATTVSSNPPAVLWIPDNWSRGPGTEAIFTANAEKIADFVNSGGGLFANMGSYGWLTALLPGAVYNNGGCNGGPEATTDGATDFSLTNTLVAACWHGYFTGNVGTLKTLVDYPYPTATDSRKAVSIGGGSVALPSSFTIGITPENPRAGEPLVITATAQTLAGVPQAGVTVTINVSSGPDAGQTFTATTNSSGVATITVNTAAEGTAVYTATATVNGVAKTVSKTVAWDPPAATTTTAAPETTTTVVLAPTTAPAPEDTQPAVTPAPTEVPVVTPAPETITLPNTGSSSSGFIMFALFFIVVGAFALRKRK
jgi:LPXTG-motif cell wall-anchored protein